MKFFHDAVNRFDPKKGWLKLYRLNRWVLSEQGQKVISEIQKRLENVMDGGNYED